MLRRTPILVCLLAIACGGAECPAVDEDALRARVREEVLAELRADNEAALRQAARELEVAPELAAVPRLRVETAHAPHRGAPQPLVTIVMFSDYQCPFCGRVEPTIRQLLDAYPDGVQVVFRNNPLAFHQEALPAAEAALEAYDQGGDATFWPFHDLLFENQRSLDRASLESYATQLGLDMRSFARALDEHEHLTRIEQDQRDAARVGARGTPNFFINGRQLQGAQPYEAFDAIVQEELATARRLLEAGVPRAHLYARFMREAREVPPAEPAPSAPAVARPTPDPSAIYFVPVAGRPSLGSDDALVTIVEFADYQCPFCSRVQPTLDQARQTYGRDLRIVYRHNPLPFHTSAMPAAEAAEEVFHQLGSAGFFRYAELLWANQRSLDEPSLVAYATQVGANAREVSRALADGRHRAAIVADQQLAQSLGASGTPCFFINGRQLRGAQPFEAFRAIIDEERARAERTLRQGTPRAGLYDALVRGGATSQQMLNP